MQQVAARRYAFRLLQPQAVEIATAHEFFDRERPLGIEPERLECLAPECERRFIGLAQLKAHALGDERKRMPPVIGAHVKLAAGKFRLQKIDNAARGIPIVDADGDKPHLARASGPKSIVTAAIAMRTPDARSSNTPKELPSGISTNANSPALVSTEPARSASPRAQTGRKRSHTIAAFKTVMVIAATAIRTRFAR